MNEKTKTAFKSFWTGLKGWTHEIVFIIVAGSIIFGSYYWYSNRDIPLITVKTETAVKINDGTYRQIVYILMKKGDVKWTFGDIVKSNEQSAPQTTPPALVPPSAPINSGTNSTPIGKQDESP